jgi:hypothetical protein
MVKRKLLDQVTDVARFRHLSIRTEQTYRNWIKRFILFHGKRHPREMDADAVRAFLTHLAVNEHVAASTQNQAFNAIREVGSASCRRAKYTACGQDCFMLELGSGFLVRKPTSASCPPIVV